nr:hypothetical protein bcere0006_21210 [Bacillus wiedmannii]
MERNNIKAITLYKNKINPKMKSIGCNLNIFDLLEYIKILTYYPKEVSFFRRVKDDSLAAGGR